HHAYHERIATEQTMLLTVFCGREHKASVHGQDTHADLNDVFNCLAESLELLNRTGLLLELRSDRFYWPFECGEGFERHHPMGHVAQDIGAGVTVDFLQRDPSHQLMTRWSISGL